MLVFILLFLPVDLFSFIIFLAVLGLCCVACALSPVMVLRLSCMASCFPGGSVVKNLPANARDTGLIPGLGRSPAEGNGNPLQYSCLENPMEGGAWPGGHKRVGLSDLGQLSD